MPQASSSLPMSHQVLHQLPHCRMLIYFPLSLDKYQCLYCQQITSTARQNPERLVWYVLFNFFSAPATSRSNLSREPTRRHFLIIRLCLDTDTYTCCCLALQFDLAIPRDIHLHSSVLLEAQRCPPGGMPRLSFCVINRTWTGCCYG